MLISSKEFYGNHVNLVKLLLKHGARVNSSDYRGKTALRYATSLCRYFTFYLSEADLTMFADDTALTITAKSLEELGEKESANFYYYVLHIVKVHISKNHSADDSS
ncbi:uncharacterized protein LOC136037831 [Artemia franciscana]